MGSNVVVSDNGVKDPVPSEYKPEAHQFPKTFFKKDEKAPNGYRTVVAQTPDEEAKVSAVEGWTSDFSKVDPNAEEQSPLVAGAAEPAKTEPSEPVAPAAPVVNE